MCVLNVYDVTYLLRSPRPCDWSAAWRKCAAFPRSACTRDGWRSGRSRCVRRWDRSTDSMRIKRTFPQLPCLFLVLNLDWTRFVTSCTPHSKHLFSSTGSGVWQYLHTGHLRNRSSLLVLNVRIKNDLYFWFYWTQLIESWWIKSGTTWCYF